jgi:hypothetical protein
MILNDDYVGIWKEVIVTEAICECKYLTQNK